MKLEYELIRKNIKNMYLRVREDGRIVVTANRLIPNSEVEAFVRKNGRFIERRRAEYRRKAERPVPVYDRGRLRAAREFLMPIVTYVHAHFLQEGDLVPFPDVTIRVMKTRWGSCTASKGHITLNARLLEVSYLSAEYVVVHEFAHFIEQNHSTDFWNIVEKYVPDYRERKKGLKNVL